MIFIKYIFLHEFLPLFKQVSGLFIWMGQQLFVSSWDVTVRPGKSSR